MRGYVTLLTFTSNSFSGICDILLVGNFLGSFWQQRWTKWLLEAADSVLFCQMKINFCYTSLHIIRVNWQSSKHIMLQLIDTPRHTESLHSGFGTSKILCAVWIEYMYGQPSTFIQRSPGEIQTSLYRNLIGLSMAVMLSALWPIVIILPPWLDCAVIITRKKFTHFPLLYYKNDVCLKCMTWKCVSWGVSAYDTMNCCTGCVVWFCNIK